MTGETGAPGNDGPEGQKGQKGEIGETGLPGETGEPGKDGVNGTKGSKVGFMKKTVLLFVDLPTCLFVCFVFFHLFVVCRSILYLGSIFLIIKFFL